MLEPQNFIPGVPQPPHDPMWWLLNNRAGWHEAELVDVEISASCQALSLTALPESLPSLTEPGGSFGGIKVPANVALGPDGSIFLLDSEGAQLKRFDPCECTFKVVPCLGGVSSKARELLNRTGLESVTAIYLSATREITGLVFSLSTDSFCAASGDLRQAFLTNDWEPYSIAFDGQRRVFVSDRANGCIHRFSSSGRWEKALMGFGSVRDIAIDCLNRLYVVTEGVDRSVRVVNAEGETLSTATRADSLRSVFPCLPFEIDGLGRLNLCTLCTVPSPRRLAVRNAKSCAASLISTATGLRARRHKSRPVIASWASSFHQSWTAGSIGVNGIE